MGALVGVLGVVLVADLERDLQMRGELYFRVLNGSNDRIFLQVC